MKNKNIPFKIGHVLIQVNHLETAMRQYRQMGFQVVPGGLPGKAHNALIYLKDGSFLELYCTNHGKFMNGLLKIMVKMIGLSNQSYSRRLTLYLPGQDGLSDYALDSVPLTLYQENMDKIRENGLEISKPRPKSRMEYHGIRLKWTLSWPESTFLPFLMSEYQPPAIIEEQNLSHGNGALGIHEIQIATSHWDKTYQEYSLFLGIEPEISYKQAGRNCLFSIKNTSIHLIEKQKNGIEHMALSCEQQAEHTNTYASLPPFISLCR
ncbi:VOC family protein [Sinanaerobacter sp. ZZT-01]|uniref:VOC family protein n=1 Tax=Sinanaerobacter sp. ZZT-01 TaxID=3111540 RepID=UPI002D77B1BA|nr:VOC family protein [Sinanaerobacter sp. ZZT-01]WRR94426.1 VOC family protein [Sinanaerobacter sp. ZZT-01]